MKKKITAMLLAVLALTASISINTHTIQAANTVTVIVDGRTVDFPDAPAYIDENGRTQVPVKFVGEALGAEVDWNEKERKVTFWRNSVISGVDTTTFVGFQIGSSEYYIRVDSTGVSKTYTMDTVAIIENSRTYVPVKYLAEALDATVRWDGANRTVYIDTVENKESKFDNHGLLLPPYANVYYQKWFESLLITYEGGKVYLSYMIPNDLPENTELSVAISCRKLDEKKDGIMWQYQNGEDFAGDREAGMAYLLPNPIGGGEVKKEMKYIPIEDIASMFISCNLKTPAGVLWNEGERYAQSSYSVIIYTQDLKKSILRKNAINWWNAKIPEYTEEITFDAATIIKIK